jgi:hypothetical protein
MIHRTLDSQDRHSARDPKARNTPLPSPHYRRSQRCWDRIAELIRNHNRLDTQVRSIGITLRFTEYSNKTIFD